LAVELLRDTYNREITFASWAIAAVPISICLTAVTYLIISLYFKPEIKDISPARKILHEELEKIGSITTQEIKIGLLVLITIFIWIYSGHKIGLAIISLGAAVMVFVLDIAKWKDVIKYVNWGVIIMYGGAIALGEALAETEAINWIADQILGHFVISAFVLMIVLSVLSKIITELISNAAAVVILVPLSFGFVSSLDLSPELMVLTVTIPAGLAFLLPIGTPANAIAYSSGYYSMKHIYRPAIIISVVSWIIFILFARFYWPLILQ
jgi:sodium-dependent dicarboxylate transporter 2/3/5